MSAVLTSKCCLYSRLSQVFGKRSEIWATAGTQYDL